MAPTLRPANGETYSPDQKNASAKQFSQRHALHQPELFDRTGIKVLLLKLLKLKSPRFRRSALLGPAVLSPAHTQHTYYFFMSQQHDVPGASSASSLASSSPGTARSSSPYGYIHLSIYLHSMFLYFCSHRCRALGDALRPIYSSG